METLVAIIAVLIFVGFIVFKARSSKPTDTVGGTGGPREVNADVKEV